MKTTIPTVQDSVDQVEYAVKSAYSDCHEKHETAYVPERNLHFCAPLSVNVPQAVEIMSKYVPGYNEFRPLLLNSLPKDSRVRIAREGSVCVYVETTDDLDQDSAMRMLKCDEFDLYQVREGQNTYRIWWD